MSLYNTVIYMSPIDAPRVSSDMPDAFHASDDRLKIAEFESIFENFETELAKKVRPLPPVRKPITLKAVLKALGLGATLATSGLIGYRFFIFTPQYKGPEVDLQGKTVVITEPTTRASRELLRNLAKRGAQLILASPDADACNDTRDKLLRSTQINSSLIDCRKLDLDSLTSVRRFAAGLLADYPKLNRVVLQSPSCVSGIVAGKKRLTHDGFEQELGKNYFATYLLSRLVIDRVNQSDGRLVLVVDTDAARTAQLEASESSDQVSLPLTNFNWENQDSFKPKKAYQRSQWFLQLFADELSRRNATSPNSVLVSNPRISRGTAPSESDRILSRGILDVWSYICDMAARLISRRTAATTLYCCVADNESLNLSKPEASSPSPNTNQAPVYQDLRQIKSAQTPDQESTRARSAAEHLWLISEKWTRLDSHPTPLPVPVRTPPPSLSSSPPPSSTKTQSATTTTTDSNLQILH